VSEGEIGLSLIGHEFVDHENLVAQAGRGAYVGAFVEARFEGS
jgi:hypothetical protein